MVLTELYSGGTLAMRQWTSSLSVPWGSIFRRVAGNRDPAEGNALDDALYQLPQEARGADNAVRVLTPKECWAYALELPPRAVVAQANERFRIKLAVRVFEGRIGAGVLLNDRKEFYRYEMTSPGNGAAWQFLDLVTPPFPRCGMVVIKDRKS